MRQVRILAVMCMALCACVPIPRAAPVADQGDGLFCEVKATAGCAACQAACTEPRRAVCIPGTDGLVLQDGSPPFCYRKAECSCQ
jgi:hypothetical protein